MTGWTFFFVLIGVVFMTAQLFRLINFIDRPTAGHHGRTCVR